MGLESSYEQKAFGSEQKRNKLCLVATGAAPTARYRPTERPTGACTNGAAKSNAVRIHQNVELFVSDLVAEKSVEYILGRGKHAWLQITRGNVRVNGESLRKGDGAAVSNEKGLMVQATERSEFLLFDLA